MKPTLLLVHGAWHNGSGFNLLRNELKALGITSQVVELSSVAKENEPIGDMYQDAKIVRDAVDAGVGIRSIAVLRSGPYIDHSPMVGTGLGRPHLHTLKPLEALELAFKLGKEGWVEAFVLR